MEWYDPPPSKSGVYLLSVGTEECHSTTIGYYNKRRKKFSDLTFKDENGDALEINAWYKWAEVPTP